MLADGCRRRDRRLRDPVDGVDGTGGAGIGPTARRERHGRPLRYDTADWRLYRDAGTGWRRREEIRDGPRDVETMPPGGSASWSGIDALFRLGADGRTLQGCTRRYSRFGRTVTARAVSRWRACSCFG
ncbi:hypothetical protein ACFQL0_02250 [Haloplanus litoreus]|uniref:hypothetical protein n=1 Tax=Haloplanus litoreus TaxID=767515 RepID=UPI00361F3DF9